MLSQPTSYCGFILTYRCKNDLQEEPTSKTACAIFLIKFIHEEKPNSFPAIYDLGLYEDNEH